jgi:endonuclease/exonuclease/phosphatase family metal-dependent hydrolase
MWDLLRRIKPVGNGSWLLIGDFNETMWQHEHFSLSHRGEKQMRCFREVLSDCNLHDLGYTGLPWTYDNKQEGSKNVKSRIDMVVACPAWSLELPEASLHHIPSFRSDHLPLLLKLFKP